MEFVIYAHLRAIQTSIVMKTALIPMIILVATISVSAQNDELPKTWTKDFVITYTFSGSMDGSRTSLKLTYDSCIYVRNTAMNAPKTTTVLLNESDRVAILKKLNELKIDKVKSEMNIAPVNDGWSELLCVGTHCVSGGTSATMSEKDRETFSLAHSWLEQFAVGRGKK
jgi:hypothetical protein